MLYCAVDFTTKLFHHCQDVFTIYTVFSDLYKQVSKNVEKLQKTFGPEHIFVYKVPWLFSSTILPFL